MKNSKKKKKELKMKSRNQKTCTIANNNIQENICKMRN